MDMQSVFAPLATMGKSNIPYMSPEDRALKNEQLQHYQLQNQQLQSQLDARPVMGQILQQSTDPQTGQLDYQKAFMGLTSNPITAPYALDFAKTMGEQQKLDLDNTSKQLESQRATLGYISKQLGSLLPYGDKVKHIDAVNILNNAYKDKVIDGATRAQLAQQLAGIPEGAPLYGWIQRLALGTGALKDLYDNTYDKIQEMRLGNRTVTQRFNRVTGRMERIDTQEEGIAPKWQEQTDPRTGNVIGEKVIRDQSGMMPRVTVPHEGFTGLDGKPLGQPQGGAPGELTPPPGVAGAGAPSGAPQPGEPIVKMGEPAKKELESFNKNIDDLHAATKDIRQMELELGLFENATKGIAGPGSQMRGKIASYMNALGIDRKTAETIMGTDITKSQLAATSSMDFVAKRMREAFKGFGRVSNLEFQTALNAKPNADWTPEAIQGALALYREGFNLVKTEYKFKSMLKAKGYPPGDIDQRWEKVMDDYDKTRQQKIVDILSKSGLHLQGETEGAK